MKPRTVPAAPEASVVTRFRAWLLWPLLVFLVGVLLGLLTSQLRYACGPWGVHCTTVADGLGRTAMSKEDRMPDDTDNRLRQHAAMRQDIPRMLAGLLLASRVVEVPRSSNLIVVMLSFLKSFLFNGLKRPMRFSDHPGD